MTRTSSASALPSKPLGAEACGNVVHSRPWAFLTPKAPAATARRQSGWGAPLPSRDRENNCYNSTTANLRGVSPALSAVDSGACIPGAPGIPSRGAQSEPKTGVARTVPGSLAGHEAAAIPCRQQGTSYGRCPAFPCVLLKYLPNCDVRKGSNEHKKSIDKLIGFEYNSVVQGKLLLSYT
jgi:hypothetical protein